MIYLFLLLLLISGGMTAFGIMFAGKDNAQKVFAIIFFGWPIILILYGLISGKHWWNEENSTAPKPAIITEDNYQDAYEEYMGEPTYW